MSRIAIYTQAYNSEKYLRKCIESVLSQTCADFRYYIADNGSTDGTRAIIREYAGNDKRIETIDIDVNSLVGTYNSSFLKIWGGRHEFLCVLDPDDWYEPAFVKTVLSVLDNTRADLVLCSSNFIKEDTRSVIGIRGCKDNAVILRGMLAKNFPSLYPFYRTLWAKVFRISLLKKYAVFLSDKIDYGNDTLLLLDYLKHVGSIAVIKDPLYNYLVRTASDSSRYRPEIFSDNLFVYNRTLDYLQSEGGDTPGNRIFAAIVYFNAVLDGIQMFVTASGSKSEKILRLSAVFTGSATKDIWETLLHAPAELREFYELDEYAIKIRSSLLAALKAVFEPSRAREAFGILTFICPAIGDFWDFHSVDSWMAGGLIENSFLLGYFEKVYSILKEMPDAEKNAFQTSIEICLAIVLSTESAQLAAIYNALHPFLDEKQVKALFLKNEVLRLVEHCELLHRYPSIVLLLLHENYQKAARLLYEALDVEDDLPVEIVAALDEALLYSSSIAMDSELYLYAKKIQALVALEKGDHESYESLMRELDQMQNL